MHNINAQYIAGIIGRMLLLLIAVSILSFILITGSPIDTLTSYIGPESTLSQEAREAIAEYWGLNDPPPERYLTWVKNILHGDFGISITYKQPVIEVIKERFSYSIVLMLCAWMLSGVLGFVLGIIAAVKQGSPFDRATKVFCLGLQSAPTFWIGLLLLSLFAVTLGWFPIGMAVPMGKLAEDVTLWDKVYHLILPVITLSLLGVGKITLYTRQKLIEVMSSDFILFARARGESEKQLVTRHCLRNIGLPVITIQFASFSELFGGMVLAETVFSYPGIGTATTAAAVNGDVPLLLGIALFSAIFVFVGNLAANILYGALDPRIKEAGDYV